MQPMDDETRLTTHEQQEVPITEQGAHKARLPGAIIPTALVGPAQQGREPCPIILPHIAIGVAVAPNVPALPAALTAAAAPFATEYLPTQVLTPVTNEGKGEETGAHEQHPEEEEEVAAQEPIAPPPPPAVPGQERGYPVITTPSRRLATSPIPPRFPPHPWGIRHNGVLITRDFSLQGWAVASCSTSLRLCWLPCSSLL